MTEFSIILSMLSFKDSFISNALSSILTLTALLKELNQLMKSAAEENGESTVRVQWEEDTEQWSE